MPLVRKLKCIIEATTEDKILLGPALTGSSTTRIARIINSTIPLPGCDALHHGIVSEEALRPRVRRPAAWHRRSSRRIERLARIIENLSPTGSGAARDAEGLAPCCRLRDRMPLPTHSLCSDEPDGSMILAIVECAFISKASRY